MLWRVYIYRISRKYAPNRIRLIRKKRGLSMEELGAAIQPEVTLTTVAKLETGQMGLTLDYINEIARVLDVTPAELIGDDDAPALAPGMRMMPVLGEIAAGNWAEEIGITDDFVPVPAYVGGPRAFALRPNGTSMDKIVAHGGILVIDPDQVELIDGKPYAVRNGHGEATCKMFRASPPRLEPCSSDPTHSPIMIGSEPFVTIGRVTFAMSPL